MGRHYKIGEFAKNLGVSAGFLKHHEKYGLLKPEVAESGYRYYEFHQAMLVVQCIRLQNMGFTSKEISEILNHTISADMRQLFEEKREIITGKYRFYQEMLRYLDQLSGSGEEREEAEAGREGGEWSILRPEPFYYVENACEGQFAGNEERYEAALRWNEYMPMVETCSRFERTGSAPCLSSVGQWYMGLRISKGAADRLNIFRNGETRLVEPEKCLVYHVRERRKRNLESPEKAVELILEEPLKLCRRHGFAVAGDIYSAQRFCSTAQAENYMEEVVMIPVEDVSTL